MSSSSFVALSGASSSSPPSGMLTLSTTANAAVNILIDAVLSTSDTSLPPPCSSIVPTAISSLIPPTILHALHASTLSHILITSASLPLLTLLPPLSHYITTFNLLTTGDTTLLTPPPVISTTPVSKYSQLLLYQHHYELCKTPGGVPWTVDDIDVWFNNWEVIRFNQTITITDPNTKIQATTEDRSITVGSTTTAGPIIAILTFHPSAISLGAAYLNFYLPNTSSTILYAPHYTPRPSRLTLGTTLAVHIPSATTIITTPSYPSPSLNGSKAPNTASLYRTRTLTHPNLHALTTALTAAILPTLQTGAIVLLPLRTFPTGPYHTILLPILNCFKTRHLEGTYRVFVVGVSGGEFGRFTKSFLEWMKPSYAGYAADTDRNPVACNGVVFCEDYREFSRVRERFVRDRDERPFVVVTVGDDNTVVGEAIKEFGGSEDNLVLITDEIMGGVVGELRAAWCESKVHNREMSDSVSVVISTTKMEPLSDVGLKKHEERLEEESKQRAAKTERARIRDEMATLVGEGATANKAAIVTPNVSGNTNSRFSASVFLKFSKNQDELAFPAYMEKPNGVGDADQGLKIVTHATITDKDSSELEMTDYGYAVDPSTIFDLVSGVERDAGHMKDQAIKMGYVHLNIQEREDMGWTKESRGRKRKVDEGLEEDEEEKEYEMAEIELREGRGIVTGRNGKPTMKLTKDSTTVEVVAEVNCIFCGSTMDGATARHMMRGASGNANVILMGASQNDDDDDDDTARMKKACGNKVLTVAADLAPIQISEGSTSFDLRLVDTPYQTRAEKATFDAAVALAQEEGTRPPYPPAPIALEETPIGGYDVSALSAVCTGQRVKSTGALVFAPVAKRSTDTLMVSNGEVDLADVKLKLAERNIKAVYSVVDGKQRVVVEGSIRVEKEKDGRIKIEGALCEAWFRVREVLYSQYVML